MIIAQISHPERLTADEEDGLTDDNVSSMGKLYRVTVVRQ